VLALGDSDTSAVEESSREPTERYEPLPGFAELPGWIFRRLGRGGRVAVLLGLVGLIALAIALTPMLRESKQERAASERREKAALRERAIQRLQAEQRPRFGVSDSVAPVGAAPGTRLEARATLMDELTAAIGGRRPPPGSSGRARRTDPRGRVRAVSAHARRCRRGTGSLTAQRPLRLPGRHGQV
jgi:hypothetical protein